MPALPIPESATGSHDRVRMQRNGQPITINGTLVPGLYDVATGNFSLFMDYQPAGEQPIAFTRHGDTGNQYKDPQGLEWTCLG